jgi:peptidoglycan hydrolase-like protein with peptidoglycan-binding domain
MTPRQARVALGIFALVAAGVAYNALYMQGEARAERRLAGQAPDTKAQRAEARRPSQPRAKASRGTSPESTTAKSADALQPARSQAGADTVRAIQRELDRLGHGPVASDGIMRPVTRAAIMSYEHDSRLPLTGEASEALLTRLVLGAPATEAPSSAASAPSPQAEALIKEMQRLLTANGYRPGPVDGRIGAETTAAIRAFEQDQGLVPRGRVSAEVLTRLQKGAARLKSAGLR